jgi:hypothetical protein
MFYLVLFVLIVLGTIHLELQRGPNPKIPPASSPNGGATRVTMWILGVTVSGLLIFETVRSGLTRTNVVLTFTAIAFAALTYIAIKGRKDK